MLLALRSAGGEGDHLLSCHQPPSDPPITARCPLCHQPRQPTKQQTARPNPQVPHAQVLLANDQALWTAGDPGKSQGWTVVPDTVTAQALANRGLLVLFLRRNADPSKPGHTAVVRPHAQVRQMCC